jgi:hypothetical protein
MRFGIGRTGARTALALGDLAALVGFIAYGLNSHGVDPLQYPTHTAIAAFPFALAWGVVAPVGGLYRAPTLRSLRSTLFRLVIVWIAVTLLGGAIRQTSAFPGEAPPIFLLTTFVFGLAFVLPWRLASGIVRNRVVETAA